MSRAELIKQASQIQIGESEQDAKQRVLILLRKKQGIDYKKLNKAELEQLNNAYEADLKRYAYLVELDLSFWSGGRELNDSEIVELNLLSFKYGDIDLSEYITNDTKVDSSRELEKIENYRDIPFNFLPILNGEKCYLVGQKFYGKNREILKIKNDYVLTDDNGRYINTRDTLTREYLMSLTQEQIQNSSNPKHIFLPMPRAEAEYKNLKAIEDKNNIAQFIIIIDGGNYGMRDEELKINDLQPKIVKVIHDEPMTLDDVLNNDPYGLLDSDNKQDIFTLKHVSKPTTKKVMPDYIANREVCKNFKEYKPLFDSFFKSLKNKCIEKIAYDSTQTIDKGLFIVLGGVTGLVVDINLKHDTDNVSYRVYIVFSNGTHIFMKLDSLKSALYKNGYLVKSVVASSSKISNKHKAKAKYICTSKNGKFVLFHDVYIDGKYFRDHIWVKNSKVLSRAKLEKNQKYEFNCKIGEYMDINNPTGSKKIGLKSIASMKKLSSI